MLNDEQNLDPNLGFMEDASLKTSGNTAADKSKSVLASITSDNLIGGGEGKKRCTLNLVSQNIRRKEWLHK